MRGIIGAKRIKACARIKTRRWLALISISEARSLEGRLVVKSPSWGRKGGVCVQKKVNRKNCLLKRDVNSTKNNECRNYGGHRARQFANTLRKMKITGRKIAREFQARSALSASRTFQFFLNSPCFDSCDIPDFRQVWFIFSWKKCDSRESINICHWGCSRNVFMVARDFVADFCPLLWKWGFLGFCARIIKLLENGIFFAFPLQSLMSGYNFSGYDVNFCCRIILAKCDLKNWASKVYCFYLVHVQTHSILVFTNFYYSFFN